MMLEEIKLISINEYVDICHLYDQQNIKYSKFKSFREASEHKLFKKLPFRFLDYVDYSWDTIFINIESLRIADFCHEAAHYFIAPDENKYLVNYGLGPGFQDSLVSKVQLKEEDVSFQELLSCVLEWSFMRHLGCPDKEISSMIYDETMSCVLDREMSKDYNKSIEALLFRNKIFNKYGFKLIY